jgi:methionyl-tRNA formyltransferase
MRVTLLSRYPRVDTPAWKRRLAEGLLQDGAELSVVYSRSSLREQASAGLRELGPAAVAEQLRKRIGRADGSDAAEGATETLASWGEKHDLPVRLFSRLDEPACLAAMRALAPDVLVLVGADIAPAALLAEPRMATVNAHYGLLPRYRGMNVTEWSIYHDDPIGVTVHVVDPGIDTGDILLREEIDAIRGDTLAALRPKHQSAAQRLLHTAVGLLGAGEAERFEQRPEEGRQFYRMHPLLRRTVEARLAGGTYAHLKG